MIKADVTANTSRKLPNAIETTAAKQESFATDALNDPECEATVRAQLDKFHNQLIEWALNPGEFELEGLVPPTRDTLALAAKVAKVVVQGNSAAYTTIAADTSGGVVIEVRQGSTYESYRVKPDGQLEWCLFQDTRLLGRQYYSLSVTDAK